MKKGVIIASVIILALWLVILCDARISERVKRFVTGLVAVSPVPPIP